jgi:hypothetical protein
MPVRSNRRPVTFDEIMDALAQLDGNARPDKSGLSPNHPARGAILLKSLIEKFGTPLL